MKSNISILFIQTAVAFLSICATPGRVSQMTILGTDTIEYDGNTPLKNERFI